MNSVKDNPVNCIDCGSNKVYTAFIRSPKDNNITRPTTDSVRPSDSLYVILHCINCDSFFLHPYYFEESFAVYSTDRYFAGYFPGNIHRGGGPSTTSPRPFVSLTRRQNMKKARFFLRLAGLEQEAHPKIAEIGCSTGNLLQGFVDCGCTVLGVDISEQAISEARKKGLNLYCGRFEDAELPNEYFDLIISCETFEHMAGLENICKKMRQTLKCNGMLIITVPNDIEGYRRIFFRKIWWMIPPMHIRYFTARSVKNIFTQHGFDVTSVKTSGSVGHDVNSIIRWFMKKWGMRRTQNSRAFKSAMTGIQLLCSPIDMCLNVFNKHCSMIVVMRKK